MTTPPNRPRGSARVPGPDDDGSDRYRGPDPDSGHHRSGQYGSSRPDSGGAHSSGRHGAEEPTTGRHGHAADSGGYDPRGGDPRGGDPRGGGYDSRGGDPRGGGYDSRGGDPRGGDPRGDGGARGGSHSGDRDSYDADRSGSYGSPTSRSYSRRLGEPAPGDDEPSGRHSRGAAGGSAGRASVGSASVGGAAAGGPPAGRASVGSASVGGGPSGRASVRPPGPDDGDPLGPPTSRADARREAKNTTKARKKRRRRRRIVAGVAVMLLLVGIGSIGGAYYFTNVTLPEGLTPNVPSTFYYSDGKTEMAKLGTTNGSKVDINKLPKYVRYAVVSAEDRSFYDNSGVDFKGVLRATWGHLMGKEDSGGASTITMQYAKLAEDKQQSNRTYSEKVKETAVALKLTQKYNKEQILGFYLNTVYFNRGASGIQAAAKVYFNKDAAKLTPEEAAVLAGVIKDPTNFDPANNLKSAQGRWEYVLQGMKDLGYYNKPISAANYPKVAKPDPNSNGASMGLDKPTGLVVRQVEQELVDNKQFAKGPKGHELKIVDNALRIGGYKIITTINKKAEDDAISVGNKELKGQQPGLADAIVSVRPGTGEVVAYYGGNDGTGYDTASSDHPPGSSFKIYVLAAALMNGYSIDSFWNGDSSEKLPGRGGDGKVHNSEDEHCEDGGIGSDGHHRCSLTQAVRKSLNTVFYQLTYLLGKDVVLQFARDCGVKTLWPTSTQANPHPKPIDLTTASMKDAASTSGVGYELGFGQNPVTPLDHASGVATFANNGVYTTEHFITKMYNNDGAVAYTPKIEHKPVFSAAVAADIDYVLSGVANHETQFIDPKRPQANKTGTWQYKDDNMNNSHAWTVGYVPQLAAATWVGQKDGGKIMNDRGSAMYGWDLPGTLWAKYMSAALNDLHYQSENFPKAQHVNSTSTKGQYTGSAPTRKPSAPASRHTTPPSHSSDPPSPSFSFPGGGDPSSSNTPSCPPWPQNCGNGGDNQPGAG